MKHITVLAFLVAVAAAGRSFAPGGRDVSDLLVDSGLTGLLMRANLGAERMFTPAMNMSDYVRFYLYTRKNQDAWQELWLGDNKALEGSNFDHTKDTFIVIHGYLNDINSEAIQLPKKTLLATYDCNVVGVDWSRISVTPVYSVAAAETSHVGRFLAEMIRFLMTSGELDLNHTHLIGHSLGAHVAGFAGKALVPLRLHRITGLDPAKPGFTDAGDADRLNATDALFVDCIHTCAGDLGLKDPICQANFYPNGGTNPQPGCLAIDFLGTCSHERSVQLYAESVYPNHQFQSHLCTSVPDSSGSGCQPSSDLMGQPATYRLPGIFYVKTNGAYPYAMIVKS